jgi:hypothetical protein
MPRHRRIAAHGKPQPPPVGLEHSRLFPGVKRSRSPSSPRRASPAPLKRLDKAQRHRLDLVKQAQGPLFDGFTDPDKVALWTFAKEVKEVSAPRAMGSGKNSHREELRSSVNANPTTAAPPAR